MKIKEIGKKLKRDIPAVYLALRKKETPFIAKLMAMITIGYALSPVDLIPDFIPILGYLDDLLILPLLVSITIRLIPHNIFIQCQIEARDSWENEKAKKWYFSIPVILFWLFILALILRKIY
ncbi:uncharacterized protein DUF1232 [Mobilisporobacter senegalensis]|uniref:Uncharacterized protein DUF1232 n=1 Tax=Mobilisporobacter senegalensis TaxID=1329262 RepID=A0A3N1XL90_9FIRM|nr:DUF1232 domain-containing protein [Mobilisporobacter senegalensis]ROR27446.1 uncharacterized protein DUF1232 [Mobilisporobacter senegalensis]